MQSTKLECRTVFIFRNRFAKRVSKNGLEFVIRCFLFRMGIRTIAESAIRYHNGSVWPHENALIAFGLLRARDKELATKILSGLFDVSRYVELHRLPELICGFSRHPGKPRTGYPVACAPQAWAGHRIPAAAVLSWVIDMRQRATDVFLPYRSSRVTAILANP